MAGNGVRYSPGSRSRDGDIRSLRQEQPPSSPLQEMLLLHEGKLALCGALESIADSLPNRFERLTCLAVANTLLPLIRRAHQLEETNIFPAYDALSDTAARSGSTQRLRSEHVEDECFAAELTEILFKIGHEGAVGDAEVFGFMLRGFFEGMRRHVAFESEHIAPLIDNSLFRSRPEI